MLTKKKKKKKKKKILVIDFLNIKNFYFLPTIKKRMQSMQKSVRGR